MLTRRQFIRHTLAFGLSAGSAALVLQLAGCAPAETPAATSLPPTVPSWTPSPTATMPPAPTTAAAAATTPGALATATPAATPSATPLPPTVVPQEAAYVAVARGDDPAQLTRRAIQALGGMERFVRPGQTVLVKPNICVAYHGPEFAATTNPQVVAAVVQMCREAGAASVSVMDYPFGGTPEQAYKVSQIGDAVRAAGGQMVVMSALKFKESNIPSGKDIKRWVVYQDALKADVLIDVPIAKHHNLVRLTLASKNLMGLVENRSLLHSNLDQRLPDLITLFKPKLTIVDAYRMLMANGPTGGNLADVKLAKTVIASHDIVAADAYAATLFGLKPDSIGYIREGAARGIGTLDLQSIRIEELAV